MSERIKEQTNNNEIAEFNTFEDFKNAFLNLPNKFLPLFLRKPGQPKQKMSTNLMLLNLSLKDYENLDIPSDKEINEEVENESSILRIARTGMALKELYKITNGVINDHTTTMETDIETSLSLFHEEIFSLWEKRKEKEPINLTSFLTIKIENLGKEIQKLEKSKINTEKEKQELLDKTKIMGPKKKEAYLKSKENELECLKKTIEISDSFIKFNKESIKKSELNIKNELFAKKIINGRMPYLSGSEYFESYMNCLNSIFRYYTKENRNKFEDILLEWALKHQDKLPLKESKNEELNKFQKKILNELWRVYPAIEKFPTKDNLEHGRLILSNFLLRLPKNET